MESGTKKVPGFVVTEEFLALLESLQAQGFTQAYLIREGLALLMRQRFEMEVPEEILHPPLGGSRKKS
jgi:hypothetical protein